MPIYTESHGLRGPESMDLNVNILKSRVSRVSRYPEIHDLMPKYTEIHEFEDIRPPEIHDFQGSD